MGTQIIPNEPVVIRTERDAGTVAAPAPADARAHILVVEDEHLVALDIQRGLERMGHRVTVAYTGELAEDLAMAHPFDLVLMDIKLRGKVDGIDAAKHIRDACDVPVIYLTAYADNPTLARARMTEPYGYVLKPFQEKELRAVIEMALKRAATDRHRWQQERLQRFLANASARLAASLDYRAVTADAMGLLVPGYADWATVHLVERDDAVPAFTQTHPIARSLTAMTDDVGDVIHTVMSTGRSTGVFDLRGTDHVRAAFGPQHVANLMRLGARSSICMPIQARGETLGALALVCGRLRPVYNETDVLWADDFCHRLAMALDNALLYRKAERAIHMRDDVLAIVSHDLRSPLGTILMQAELLSDRPDLGKVGMQIARSAQLMNRLIGDLLDASAINAGRLALDCNVHSVNDILLEAGDMFGSQAEAGGIELHLDAPQPPANVRCDSDRIVQVLSNLIGNALKFTPRGGRVDVSATRVRDAIRLEVRDSGRGIAPEQVPYLFDRYWRAKPQRHGAGLGLFIARGIVASHDSRLELETTVGKGSRFYFCLPEIVG
jgi:signal transduction histidine kinase/CheY-like chemotaxis protein